MLPSLIMFFIRSVQAKDLFIRPFLVTYFLRGEASSYFLVTRMIPLFYWAQLISVYVNSKIIGRLPFDASLCIKVHIKVEHFFLIFCIQSSKFGVYLCIRNERGFFFPLFPLPEGTGRSSIIWKELIILTGIPLMIAFILAIIIMILAISKYNIHPSCPFWLFPLSLALLAAFLWLRRAKSSGLPMLSVLVLLVLSIASALSSLWGHSSVPFWKRPGLHSRWQTASFGLLGKTIRLLPSSLWVDRIHPCLLWQWFCYSEPDPEALVRRTHASGVATAVAMSMGALYYPLLHPAYTRPDCRGKHYLRRHADGYEPDPCHCYGGLCFHSSDDCGLLLC